MTAVVPGPVGHRNDKCPNSASFDESEPDGSIVRRSYRRDREIEREFKDDEMAEIVQTAVTGIPEALTELIKRSFRIRGIYMSE